MENLPQNVKNSLERGATALRKGRYNILGLCKVDASDTIGEWYGYLLEDAKGREIPVGRTTLLGVGFKLDENGKNVASYISKQLFQAHKDVMDAYGKSVNVTGFEDIEVQVYNSDETRMKKFPILSF